MRRIPGCIPILLLAALYTLMPLAHSDETDATNGPGTTPLAVSGPRLEEVEAALANIEADGSLDEASREALRRTYSNAVDELRRAAEFAVLADTFAQSRLAAPVEAAQVRATLQASAQADDAALLPPNATAEQIRQALDASRLDLNRLNESLAKIDDEVARAGARPIEIGSRTPEVQRELAAVRQELADSGQHGETLSPELAAERTLLQARQTRLVNEAGMLAQENHSLRALEDLLQSRQELLSARAAAAAAAVRELESLLQQRVDRDASRVLALADALPETLSGHDPATQLLTTEVRGLAREVETAVEQLQQVGAAQRDLEALLGGETERLAGIREQLELGGGGSAMAQILLDTWRRYPDQIADLERLRSRVIPLEQARIASLNARLKLRDQARLAQELSDDASGDVAKLLSVRREALETLRGHYRDLVQAVAMLEAGFRQYREKIEETYVYVAGQLFGFGMRSSPPLGIETLTAAPEGLSWALKPDHWQELRAALRAMVKQMPARCAAVSMLVAVLLLAKRRIAAALVRTGERIRRVMSDRFLYTGEALLWTVLLAAPVPLALAFLGWGLAGSSDPSPWLRGLADGLRVVAAVLFGLSFLLAMSRPGGLAAVHFRLSHQGVQRSRRVFQWFAPVYLPTFLISLVGLYEASDYFFTIGRLSFMVAHVWAALLLWRLLNFSDGIMAVVIRESPGSLVSRWRYLWFPLVILAPLALVAAAGLGYMITAIHLSLGFLATGAVVAGGFLLYRLALRWVRMRLRKLALAEALKRRRERQQAAAVKQGQEAGDVVTPDAEADEEINLVSISDQTRYLLRLSFSLAVATAILLLAADAFPVIATFDAVVVPLTGGRTLLDLLRLALIVIITTIAVQNLPGLLELAVLRATTAHAGTRYAIATLCKYTVVIIGVGLAFSVLNLDWEKFGWIAAALSVGLGFGLQEVVANFVCGLIVLFERPIRVGDFVTVDGVSGTVTRIRIRSTTITNGDRQDFMVPNKRLITGPILNWTLNAGLNRIIIRLGIPPGSDTEQARRVLMETAIAHPRVLKEPAPMATFEEFGANSLRLMLCAYLPSLESRSTTVSELNTEIDRRFAAAGIEIPR